MSKNGKGPQVNIVEAYSEEILSSGVKVTVLPFPARLYDNLQTKAQSLFPDPVPPKRIIKVVDGTEEIDDTNDPTYVEDKNYSKAKRDEWLGSHIGQSVLDFCIVVDTKAYEKVIKKLEETLGETAPEDIDERKVFFLINYALRGRADYERVTSGSLAQMALGDKEINVRMESFRSEMERAVDSKPQTSRPDESIGVDLERT